MRHFCYLKWKVRKTAYWNIRTYAQSFRSFSPDCMLHTAITHVILVFERWSPRMIMPSEFTWDSTVPILLSHEWSQSAMWKNLAVCTIKYVHTYDLVKSIVHAHIHTYVAHMYIRTYVCSYVRTYTVYMHVHFLYSFSFCLLGVCKNSLWLKVPQSKYGPWYLTLGNRNLFIQTSYKVLYSFWSRLNNNTYVHQMRVEACIKKVALFQGIKLS